GCVATGADRGPRASWTRPGRSGWPPREPEPSPPGRWPAWSWRRARADAVSRAYAPRWRVLTAHPAFPVVREPPAPWTACGRPSGACPWRPGAGDGPTRNPPRRLDREAGLDGKLDRRHTSPGKWKILPGPLDKPPFGRSLFFLLLVDR